jgi:phosphoglycolate phosphatase
MKSNLTEQIQFAVKGKRHIIWDWNGTLLDDVGHAVSVVNTLLEEHNLVKIDRHQYRKLFEFPVSNYYYKLGFDFEKESFEDLCHKFVDRFMAGFKDLPLIPEMKSVLLELHRQGHSQSVLSATDQPNLNSMITHFNLSEIFQNVFGIENKLAASKIERGHELIKISHIPKSETVIVGDTLHDLEVAHALGIDAVLISHGHQCPTRLKSHHKFVIEV